MGRKRRLFVILISCFLLIGLMSGCGKKMTAEELLAAMTENSKQTKSMEGDFVLDMDLGMEQSGVSMSMNMGIDGTLEMLSEPAAMHMEGSLNLDLMNLNMDYELYSLEEDGKTNLYIKAADQWTKVEGDAEEEIDAETDGKAGLQDFFEEKLVLSKKSEKINGQEVYVLSGKIGGDKLEEAMTPFKEAMENQGVNVNLGKMDIPLILKVYKESKLPASAELDFGDFVNSILAVYKETNGTVMTTKECRLIFTFADYDGVESIEIPQEAKDAAEQNIQTLMEDIDNASGTATELELGTIEDRTYASEFLGLSCTVPDGWTYYTEEQLKEMNKTVYDAMEDGNLKEAVAKADLIYDMFAANQSTRENINIVIENLGQRYGSIFNEASYLDFSAEQVKSGLEGIGITDITAERNTVEMAGEMREGLIISGNCQAGTIYEQLVAISKGDHMACITFTCFNENTLVEMAGYFGALEKELTQDGEGV